MPVISPIDPDTSIKSINPQNIGKAVSKNIRSIEQHTVERLNQEIPQKCLPQNLTTKEKVLINMMIIGSYIGTASLLLQAYQIYDNHDDLSSFFIPTWVLYSLSSLVWFLYTLWVMKPRSRPMQLSALLSFIFYTLIIVMLFVY